LAKHPQILVDNGGKAQYITQYYGFIQKRQQTHSQAQKDFTGRSAQCQTQQHEQAQKASVQSIQRTGPQMIKKNKPATRPYFLHVALHSNTWIALLQVAVVWSITTLMVCIPVLLYLTN
jgi:hypothetical protein